MGKNITKNLSAIYRQKFPDHAGQSSIDAFNND